MKQTTIILILTILTLTTLHANPNFIGTWTADVEYNRQFDTYKINLSDNGRCIVRVSNDNGEQQVRVVGVVCGRNS